MSIFQPPPTWAEVVLVDDLTQKGKFNPVWLNWFLQLTDVFNVAGNVNLNRVQGTANRVPFGDAAGLLTDDADLTFDGTDLTLGVSSKLKFGTDVNLYRAGTDLLKTDDSFGIGITPVARLDVQQLDQGINAGIRVRDSAFPNSNHANLLIAATGAALRYSNLSNLRIQYYDVSDPATIVDIATFTSNGEVLVGTTSRTAGEGKIQLATHTTKDGGIFFGPGINLYRVGTTILKTDQGFTASLNIRAGGSLESINTLFAAESIGNSNAGISLVNRIGKAGGFGAGTNGVAIEFQSDGVFAIIADTRSNILGGGLTGPIKFIIDGNGLVGLGSSAPTTGEGILQLATHTTKAGGVFFGSDVNLYRSAANVLSSDDSLALGTNPSSTGISRLPNDNWIAARNAANTADINCIKVNASNRVQLGAPLAGTVYKTADESVASSTVLQDDDHLIVTLEASRTYWFKFFIFTNNVGALEGFKCALGGTVGVTSLKAQIEIFDDTTNSLAALARVTALGTSVGAGLGTGDSYAEITGTIETSTSGTFLLQWAQNTSGLNNTTVQRNSSFVALSIN